MRNWYFFSILFLSSFQSLFADCYYALPYKSGTTHRTLQGYFGKYTHIHPLEYAVDFEMKEGTDIHASRSGTVIEIKDDSNLSGKDKSFLNKANYIKVQHIDNSIGYYAHLKKSGVLVKLNEKVSVGQKIGISGCTGWCDGAHLHFEVHTRNIKTNKRKTHPIRFLTKTGPVKNIERQKSYTAVTTGKDLCK